MDEPPIMPLEPPPTPRWVKVGIAIVGVLVLIFIIMHLLGGGFRSHAPLR